MILAGDIGGPDTRLALFDGDPRTPVRLATYPSREHESLEEMVEKFPYSPRTRVSRACFGVAGPVRNGRCVDTTNLAWPVEGSILAAALGLPVVSLLNDLEVNAHGIAPPAPDDLAVLNQGLPDVAGNAAVISSA